MPMSPSQAMSRDQAARTRTTKRDLILTRAHDLFLVQGFGGTSIDQIAEAAGVSRQTIYNNFDSKQALFKAIAGALAEIMSWSRCSTRICRPEMSRAR